MRLKYFNLQNRCLPSILGKTNTLAASFTKEIHITSRYIFFQFHLNVRVSSISSSPFKLLDAVAGGEGGGQQLGEDQVDLGDTTDGAAGSSTAQHACHTGLLFCYFVFGVWRRLSYMAGLNTVQCSHIQEFLHHNNNTEYNMIIRPSVSAKAKQGPRLLSLNEWILTHKIPIRFECEL